MRPGLDQLQSLRGRPVGSAMGVPASLPGVPSSEAPPPNLNPEMKRVAQGPSQEAIDPIMNAYQRSAPELGPSASGRIEQVKPTSEDMTQMAVTRGIGNMSVLQAIDMLSHMGLLPSVTKRSVPQKDLPPVQTGLPTTLRPAPPAELKPIGGELPPGYGFSREHLVAPEGELPPGYSFERPRRR